MKWRAQPADQPNRYYLIKYDDLVGYYLFVYENNVCIFDYLQDTLEIAQEQSLDEFGVRLNEWIKIES